MAITAGQTALAADFVNTSAGAGDAGKGVKLNAAGVVERTMSQLSVQTVAGTTLAITTVTGQRVLVWASGVSRLGGGGGDSTVELRYNGVSKHSLTSDAMSSNNSNEFCLMYTEIPGAGTHDITVVESGTGGLESVVIMVLFI